MTAELLVRTGAFGAYLKTLVITHCKRVVQLLALPASERFLRYPDQAGFTLVELMTTLTIMGVLSTMMAPSVAGMMEAERVKSVTYDLYVAVAHARVQAVTLGIPATLLPHDGGYSKGYDLQVNNDIILSNKLAGSQVVIKTGENESIGYDKYGRPTMSTPYQIEISSAIDKNVPKRCLIVGLSGRINIEVDNNHDGDCSNG